MRFKIMGYILMAVFMLVVCTAGILIGWLIVGTVLAILGLLVDWIFKRPPHNRIL